MLMRNYRVDLNALMRTYENNYVKLLKLMPQTSEVEAFCVYNIQEIEFQLDIVESTRYATLLRLVQQGKTQNI